MLRQIITLRKQIDNHVCLCYNGRMGHRAPMHTAEELNTAWNEFGAKYTYHEYKDSYNRGGKVSFVPCFKRMCAQEPLYCPRENGSIATVTCMRERARSKCRHRFVFYLTSKEYRNDSKNIERKRLCRRRRDTRLTILT